MDLKSYLHTHATAVDAALDQRLPRAHERPTSLHEAMRYCVFSGGKRFRPILCLAAAEACGGETAAALAAACAVELVHTYSLVHDDLPAMDDDDLRRGRPTCHKVYGEAMAILCGDALLTEAFLILAETPQTAQHSSRDFLKELATAGNSRNLIGGQVMDLEGEGKKLSHADLIAIHEAKTAALLIGSLRLGAMTAGASAAELSALMQFGRALGLAYQVLDDILDVTQSTEILGKTAGKDLAVEKSTYPAILGLDASRKEAARLTEMALTALRPFGTKGLRLQEIAAHLLQREF
jgi:geranylgeranyl diphosphate synthase, type II